MDDVFFRRSSVPPCGSPAALGALFLRLRSWKPHTSEETAGKAASRCFTARDRCCLNMRLNSFLFDFWLARRIMPECLILSFHQQNASLHRRKSHPNEQLCWSSPPCCAMKGRETRSLFISQHTALLFIRSAASSYLCASARRKQTWAAHTHTL